MNEQKFPELLIMANGVDQINSWSQNSESEDTINPKFITMYYKERIFMTEQEVTELIATWRNICSVL